MNGMEIDVWIMRAAVGAIVAACVGLFVRLRKVETGRAVADERINTLEGRGTGAGAGLELAARLDGLERDVATLRLHMAEHYVRRDDWVQMTSRVIGMLEDHSVMLARLDERFGAAERIWNGDGK